MDSLTFHNELLGVLNYIEEVYGGNANVIITVDDKAVVIIDRISRKVLWGGDSLPEFSIDFYNERRMYEPEPQEILESEEKIKERLIEIYVGHGSDGSSWHVADAWVPANLPQKQAEEQAMHNIRETLDGRLDDYVAFMGVYCYWTGEMMEYFWGELEDEEE